MRVDNNTFFVVILLVLVAFANALLTIYAHQTLKAEIDAIANSNATMVDTWNEGSVFLTGKIVDLELNQADIAEHVGLDFVDGEMQPFDMECLLMSDDQDPPRLKCNKTFGDSG